MSQLLVDLLRFVDHGPRCDFTAPMWHKGPCDCGLFELFELIEENAPAGVLEQTTMPVALRDAVRACEAYQRWLTRGDHER